MHSVPTAAGGYGDLRGAMVALQVFLVLIAIIFCALRTYSRILILSRLGPDDYIMLLATVLSLALAINTSVGTIYGWGLHITDVLHADYSNVLLVSWIAQLLFTLATVSVKVSILSFYLRLANTKIYRRVIYASIIWMVLWGAAFVFVVIFQCFPVEDYWLAINPGDAPHCIDAGPPLIVNGVTNILNDVFVYILPMPMLWRLQMPIRQRISLLCIFGVGSISCIAGAMRVYYAVLVNADHDSTWTGFDLWTWEAVEIDLGIACACAPAVKPLLVRWFPRIMASIFGVSSTHTADPSKAPGGSRGFIPMGDTGIYVERGVTVVRQLRVKNDAGRWDDALSVDTQISRTWAKDGSSEESLTSYSPPITSRLPRD